MIMEHIFKCEACNKNFKKKQHLQNHYKSQAHLNFRIAFEEDLKELHKQELDIKDEEIRLLKDEVKKWIKLNQESVDRNWDLTKERDKLQNALEIRRMYN
jgi:hypothetical protein